VKGKIWHEGWLAREQGDRLRKLTIITTIVRVLLAYATAGTKEITGRWKKPKEDALLFCKCKVMLWVARVEVSWGIFPCMMYLPVASTKIPSPIRGRFCVLAVA